MEYEQIKAFNQSKGGTKPYWCLANVRAGYGIKSLLPDAWTAWKNTQQHKNRNIPKGVDVPLFYSFTATLDGVRKNWGHINVRLKDGRIWNDGKIFPNLKSFEQALTNVHYVGWGESVNNERVIKKEDDMYKGKSAKAWYKLNKLHFETLKKRDKYIKNISQALNNVKKDLSDLKDDDVKDEQKKKELQSTITKLQKDLDIAEREQIIEVGEDTRSWVEKLIDKIRS